MSLAARHAMLSASGFDSNAQSIITTLGITDEAEVTGINAFVSNLKMNGIWSKIKRLYPFYGSTASLHKWNWKDMQDTDAAGRLVFGNDTEAAHNTGVGYTPNGTNQDADTKTIFNNIIAGENFHIGYFSPTRGHNNGIDIGASPIFVSKHLNVGMIQYANGQSVSNMYADNTKVDEYSFMLFSKNGTTSLNYQSGLKISETTITATAGSTQTIKIGSYGSSYYTKVEFSYVTIGDPLTDSECVYYSYEVDKLLTLFGRNIIRGVYHGDSITAGVNASNRETLSYRALLAGLFGSNNISKGYGGYTLEKVTNPYNGTAPSWFNIYSTDTIYKNNQRKYLIIMYGMNDATFRMLGSTDYDADLYYTQLDEIVQHLINVKGWPAQSIIISTFIFAKNGIDNSSETQLFIDAMQDVAELRGTQFVNIYEYFKNNQSLVTSSDNLHPDDAYHNYIANWLYANIQKTWV